MGFLPREIRFAFPGESQLRQSRATQPTVHAGCFSVSITHRTLTWTTGYLTCAQMLMRARWCTDTRKRVCTESCLWEKNLLPHRGIEPASAACRSDALPTELHPWVIFIIIIYFNKQKRERIKERKKTSKATIARHRKNDQWFFFIIVTFGLQNIYLIHFYWDIHCHLVPVTWV